MDNKRPRARQKNVTSGSKGVHRRGSGLGTGPVGSGKVSSGRTGGSGSMKRAAVGGGIGLPAIIAIAFAVIKMFGGGGNGVSQQQQDFIQNNNSFTGEDFSSNSTPVDNSVAKGSREKYTNVLGNNKDSVTVMIYICGTDLESKHGMASSDIQEMAAAKFGDNVNVILYTGGCKQWKINGISNKVHQIYQIKDGELIRLESDMGKSAMTDPENLTEFIKYCKKNFPANRNNLIMWDHGGGSVSGYGYDETNAFGGSMDLAEIDKALTNAGVKFDFIGFDACLMATAETALMLNDHADYMIASEETEPGIGWYYTNWLSKLGSNTSMPTVEIGKNIIDDFVDTCAKKCRGQKTTLSIIDLAEFSNTVPDKLNSFAQSISTKLTNKEYKEVSDARYTTREFAVSSKIDQVDLAHLALNMDNSEGKALSNAIQNAVKYNRTSSDINNAYGVSIYFPYRKTSSVDTACSTYNKIGMDSEYSQCIKQFASLETAGQISAGGTSSPVPSLLDMLGSATGSSGGSADMIGQLLGAFLGGTSDRSIAGLDSSNTAYMNDTALSADDTAEYISANYFDPTNLIWEQNSSGEYIMELPESQWELVHTLDKNLFYDDGTGYVDMGLDNVYTFDDDGNLIADTDDTWVAIDGQPVAYYHTDTTEFGNDRYSISGYVPAYLNDERVNLIIVFDSENPNGYIAGASTDYINSETDTVAKNMIELEAGDTLDFICDYYTYDGTYSDSYYLGEQIIVTDNMEISNVSVGDGNLKISYCFTDIYNQVYWTETINE